MIDFKSGGTFIMSPRPEQLELKFVPARNEMKQVDSTSQIMSNQPSIAEGQHFLMSGVNLIFTFRLCFWYRIVIIVSVVCHFY